MLKGGNHGVFVSQDFFRRIVADKYRWHFGGHSGQHVILQAIADCEALPGGLPEFAKKGRRTPGSAFEIPDPARRKRGQRTPQSQPAPAPSRFHE